MTIKNYVLLDDKRIVEICGKTKFGYEYVDSKTESGIVITRTILEDRIVKTSNNILDLVEVGDLVEYDRDLGETFKLEVIDIQNNKFQSFGNYCYKKNVIAIYKKQPKGYEYVSVKKTTLEKNKRNLNKLIEDLDDDDIEKIISYIEVLKND